MHITELDSYNLDDAVKFNDQLNPRLWDDREHLRPEVRERLLEIANDFREFLGVTDLAIKDITVSGSNAAYTYTPNSDIDLHLVVDIPNDPVYRELFDAKKFQYNEQHDIKIGGADVELYVQDADKPHISQGIYSLLNNDWLQVPRRVRSVVDDTSTRNKFESVGRQIEQAIKSGNLKRITRLAEKIKKMRQTGLENHGEFGPENLAFKMLRSQGLIKQLYDARNSAKDREFSLKEKAVVTPKVTYGFRTPTVVEADTVALEEAPKLSDEEIFRDFIDFCFKELKLQSMPVVKLRKDPQWSVRNRTFGRYIDDRNLLEVAWGQRHIMDVLRTVAHELTHRHQHERESVPGNAGETGSPYENEANARAGVLMRDYAQLHPEHFAVDETELEESASGYIPTKRQARDPRYSMALTVDIKPGQLGKEANKLNLKTNRQGIPQVAKANGLFEKLALELDNFKQQDLFEINMGSKNLRREAAKTGAIAGMEFEMIVPNVEGGGDEDLEPDYDMDERCRSIQDAYDFFYDGDFNSRRDCDAMRDSMRDDYTEWLDDKIATDWNGGGEEYILEWVKNNVDESVWNPDDLAGDARNEALEEYSANVHADPNSRDYESAYEEFREENQESYDESDWLDDADLDRMSYVEGSYSMNWPHWRSQGGGEANIEDVAQEFENAIGRDVRASGNYHSGSVIRPSPTQLRYIVEPDGSLEPDNSSDQGLEFVSPPLPIDEILSDLNKVKRWAKEYGCYTNDSTGLHINISVPDYSRERLDFVKLALLMGDKYVLDAFGRSGNTYAKSALDIVKKAVRDNPDNAAKLLDKMKGNLDQLATKAIHSGSTSKYTSINTKDGHIEFRSPGGDWLDQNFDQIENTLLRFTVAMSAALNPDAYRQEYLTKLYKLLSDGNKDVDTIKYFSDYVAGKIPKAALRSFIKQAQLQRNIKRGKTDGQKMWWKVYKEGKNAGRYSYTVEVVATSEKEAIDKAAAEWGLFSQEYKSRMDAEVLRPYVEQPDKPGAAQTGTGTYELFDRRTGEAVPDTEFPARNQSDVNTRLDDYIDFGPHGIGTVDARLVFGARPVDAADQDNSANPLRPTGPGPWEVYNRQTGNSTVNLIQGGQPITDRGAAQRQAMALISTGRHDLYGVRTRGTDTISPQSVAQRPSEIERDWRIVDRETDETLNTVRGASQDQALAVRADTARRHGVDARQLSLQVIFNPDAAQQEIPEVPLDIEQNFPDRTDGRNIDYSFRDLFGNTDQASSAPAGNSFSGQWRVMIDGEEVWRFRGVGNNQADANRIAQLWLRDQRGQGLLSPAEGADIEVVPVMTESVMESANPADTLYFFDVAKGGRSFDHLDLRIMGLKKSQKGRWYYQPGRDSTDLLTTATLKYLEKTLNVPARAWTKPVTENTEQKPVVIYTNNKGATIDDGIKKSLRTTQEPFNKLQMWEKHKSMKDPKIADWVTNKLLPELKQNGVLKPLLVWNNNGQLFVIDGNHRFLAYQEAGFRGRVPVQIVPDNMITISDTVPGQQSVAESVNDYLWHGSKSKHDILYPQQANDTGGKKESNKNAVYATPSAKVAIAMGLTTPGSDTGMFPNDPQMILFKGGIRKGQMIYLHKVPKDLFIKHNDREWYSKPGVKEVKPLEVVTVPVDKWLHLIRQATPQDLELQKKYMKEGVTEGESNDTAISLSKLGKFHPGADTLAQFVPERATAQYALHPDKWESTFYSLTNKDSDKLKYYGPKKISIPPGTLVGDMAIANKFYRAKTPEEKQQYAELYKASLQPYPVDVSEYRMPELLIPKQGVAESRIIDPERVDVYYRPVPDSRGRRVVARNIPTSTLEPLLQKLSEKYAVPVESFEWTPSEPITEAFDQPYAIQWRKQNGDWHATADLDDGSELIVLFMSQGDNQWMVEFERDENMEITGEGDAPRVFATVLTAMQQFIAKRKPARLNFSAEKEDDPTGSRARLYDRMIQRYITGTGYDLTRKDVPGGATYTLTKQAPGVAEGLDDNGISFQVQKGKNKFATTLSMGNNPVGVYQYNATTGRSIAEVYPEFKGKGLGKLLVLHAIYTATQLGLDFQEDESRTSEYDNVLDSLSSNGYIVDDDGYWYVTGEGEQYLKQSLKQGVAEGINIGQEWMSDTELDQYVPDQLQQQWRELLGYDRNGNPSALWTNLTGGYEPDVRDPQHRSLMVKVANKWFAAKKIPNVKFYDVKDADDELEWLVQIGPQNVAENFADGKGPGRPGDSQRHGIPKHATMAELEKASHAKGRKGQLARWQLNMRRGHKK